MPSEDELESEVERALQEEDLYSEDDDSIDDPSYKLPRKYRFATSSYAMANDALVPSPATYMAPEHASSSVDVPQYREATVEGHGEPASKSKFPRMRTFVTGGEGATPRKITADLDSDDEIILDMKDKGYRNEEVRERLIKEDRVTYNAKTIETRYARLRRQIRHAQDKKLDQDFSDWHEDEDEKLLAIHNSSTLQRELEEKLERVRDNHYQEIASTINKDRIGNGQNAKYSRHAVRDRIETLLGDASTVPSQETDPQTTLRKALVNLKQSIDVTVRAKQLEQDHAEQEENNKREQERIAFAEEYKRQEEFEKQKRMAERAETAAKKKADAEIARQNAAEGRQRRRDYTKKLKEAAEAEQEQRRARRAAREFALENAKVEKAAKLKLKRAMKLKERFDKEAAELDEMKTYKRTVNILRRHMRKCGFDVNAALEEDESEEDIVKQASKRKPGRPSNVDLAKRYGIRGEASSDDSAATQNNTSTTKPAPSPKHAAAVEKLCIAASDATKSPRMKLSVAKLRSLLRSRELPRNGNKTTMVMRLQAADLSSKYADLEAECRRRGVSFRGTKAEKAWRIADDDVKKLHVKPPAKSYQGKKVDKSMVSDDEEESDDEMHDGIEV